MRGLIRKIRRPIVTVCALALLAGFASCAHKKETTLVQDPDDKREGMIPWNKQEKWETTGQLSGVTDRR